MCYFFFFFFIYLFIYLFFLFVCLFVFLEKAETYKDDGNESFKRKKYRWAIDHYTEGIKCNAPDKLLNAVLYSNRAAAHFHKGTCTFML